MPGQQANPVCSRLESQLASFDRSAADPARADQIRKFEEAAASQQTEIERQEATSRRLGCENNNFFVLFSGGQSQQCGPLNSKIQQMRANLDRINSDLERLRSAGGPERDGQRRAVLVALAQNNCGQQYRAAVASTPPRSGNLFEALFGPGPGSILAPSAESGGFTPAPGGSYRTVCVRTCDGFYYPISFATDPSRFGEDEKTCQRSCPAAEVMLFSHRNPGEDMNQAVSATDSRPYSSLPNAFKYRQAFDSSCSCKRPGETWAQTLKNVEDSTVEQGDIVVNEQRARQMSQPRVDAQGRPIRPDSSTARPAFAPAAKPAQTATPAPSQTTPADATAAEQTAPPVKPDANRTVRAVGPTFLPGR